MKKVLSFVLVLSMILGSFGMAFAAPAADVVGKDYEDAVNVLTELGVVAGYKDGTYRPENVVTRAEMATFIIKALGLNDYAVGKSEFTDMAGHWADPYVAYAVSLGFVKGNTDGTFAPNATVTYDQAITMLVQALGYKAEYMVGGYPGAFVNQAKTLGMLEGVQAGAAGANRGDVAVLLFNTLPARFVRYDADGKLDQVVLTGQRYDNMLTRLGVVGADDAAFVLNQTHVASANINVAKYVGAYVTAYTDKWGDILAIDEVKSEFLTGKLNAAKDKLTVDGVDYVLTQDAKDDLDASSAAAITVGAVEFVNGEIGDIATIAANTTYTFAVNLSGKTIKAVYSVSDWDVTEDGYFTKNDALDIEEDDELFGEAFFLDKNQEIDMTRFELVGVDSLEDIKEDDVVYVYTGSQNNKITRIAVGRDAVEGKVTKVNADSDEFTVNGKVYYEGAAQATNYADPKAGDEVKLTLDAYGDIYDSEKISGESEYAVVLEVANGEKGLNGKDALVKLFLADGTAKTFKIDSDIEGYTTVAGTNITISTAATKLTTGAIVKFSVDKDGVIDAIEAKNDGSATKAISAKGTFNGNVIQKTAVIFCFNGSDRTDEDYYSVVKFESILDAESANAKYVLDTEGKEIVAMLITDFTTDEEVYGLFNGYAYVDGDYDCTVDVLVGKETKTYNTSKTFAETTGGAVTSAAVYKLTFDAAGAVKDGVAIANDDKTAATTAAMGATVSAVDGRYLMTSGGAVKYTMADDVVVYKWNAVDSKWEVGRTRDLHNATSSAIINLYSVNGDDNGIYDIVTIFK